MRLAIVKLSALGDIIHASFLPQFIKNYTKGITIDWFIDERFEEILQYNPYIDNIISLKLKQNKKLKEIKKIFSYKNSYDMVLDLQGLIKSALISKILGKSYGFDKNSAREKAASFLYHKKFYIPYEKNVIFRNFELAKNSLKIDMDTNILYSKKPSLYYPKKSEENIKKYLSNRKKNIILIMGSSWESKVYPKEKFLNIVKKIDAHFLLSWGNKKEKNSADFILQNSSNTTMLPKTNLNDLKALISNSDLVIGADSGPTHMAWALNKPSITIFGPTPSNRNTLKTKINLTVDCNKTINPLKLNKDDFCIRTITEETIIKKATRLLNG